MRLAWLSVLLVLSSGLQAATKADLERCREYSDPAVRGQCINFYERPSVRASQSKCRKDIECWSELYRPQALKYCAKAFNRRAQYSSLWAEHWSGQDLDKARWFTKVGGAIVYYEQEAAVTLQCIFYPNAPAKVRVKIGSAG